MVVVVVIIVVIVIVIVDPQHLQLDDDFDNYLGNEGLEVIIGEKGMRNLIMDDQSY